MAPGTPGPPVTWGGGPRGDRAGLWQSVWSGFRAGRCRWLGRAWSRWRGAGAEPCRWEGSGGRQGGYLGLTSPPPRRRRWLSRGGLAGREPAHGVRTGHPWGGAGWRGCHHRHLHPAALQPPSSGTLGAPFPVTSGTDGGGCWSWPWGSASPSVPEPGAWQQLLFQACLAARQALSPDPALIQGVCKKPGSYKFGLCWRENGYGAGAAGGLLSDRQLRGRGAPAPGLGCAAGSFPLPPALSSASTHLRQRGSSACDGGGHWAGGVGLFPESGGGLCPPRGLRRALP